MRHVWRNCWSRGASLDTWIEEEGLGFLIELARRKGIDPPSVINVADLSADIAQSLHEGEPMSTAFIVGDIDKIERLLPQSELRLVRTGHIREMSSIIHPHPVRTGERPGPSLRRG